LTSSAGRLFDAIAFFFFLQLAGLNNEVSYEAQAAIALEMQATDRREENRNLSVLRSRAG